MRYCYIILIALSACGSGTNKTEALPTLISCSNEFVMPREKGDTSYSRDHENFISKYFSIRYEEKRIIATTLIAVHCVDSLGGRIEISNDTIFLEKDIIKTDDRHCPEFHKFTFIISNPGNRKYKIVSKK